jgi:hypothetical protein
MDTRPGRSTHITLQRGQEILATDWYTYYLSIQGGWDCRLT